jgi:hypothetical protein
VTGPSGARPRILIAGGYGVVGGAVARSLREMALPVDLVLAGRNPGAGAALAAELDATVVELDVARPALERVGPVDLIVAALQDPADALVAAAMTIGAAHVGVTRGPDSIAPTVAAVAHRRPARPIVIAGHWQAGALAWAAIDAARAFDRLDAVRMSALYDYADPIGPMTSGDAEGFFGRALVRSAGAWTWLDPQAAAVEVERPGVPPFSAMPMSVLDVASVAAATGAADVRFDLGVGASRGTLAGRAASHDLWVDLAGTASGAPLRRRVGISAPQGQARLTAYCTAMLAARALGLDGQPTPPAGLHFPETLIDAAEAVARLRKAGVEVAIEEDV